MIGCPISAVPFNTCSNGDTPLLVVVVIAAVAVVFVFVFVDAR